MPRAIRLTTWIATMVSTVAVGLIILWIVVGPMRRGLCLPWKSAPAATTGGHAYRGTNALWLSSDKLAIFAGIPQSHGPVLYLGHMVCVPVFTKELGPDGLPLGMLFEPQISFPAGLPIAWAFEALAVSLALLFVCRRVRRRPARGFQVATAA
jgi:hypothetical protein